MRRSRPVPNCYFRTRRMTGLWNGSSYGPAELPSDLDSVAFGAFLSNCPLKYQVADCRLGYRKANARKSYRASNRAPALVKRLSGPARQPRNYSLGYAASRAACPTSTRATWRPGQSNKIPILTPFLSVCFHPVFAPLQPLHLSFLLEPEERVPNHVGGNIRSWDCNRGQKEERCPSGPIVGSMRN